MTTDPLRYRAAAVEELRGSVKRHLDGLERIDREFDAACERIERSIAGVAADKSGADTAARQVQHIERQLREKAAAVRREIAETDTKIAKASQGLAAAMADIAVIASEMSSLEDHISNRWLIVDIYYYFAQESDEARKRCRALQAQLDSAGSRTAALEKTKREFAKIKQQREARAESLQRELEEIDQKLRAMERSRVASDEQSRRLLAERQQAMARREKRRADWHALSASDWEKTVREVERDGHELCLQQPSLTTFGADVPVVPSGTPKGLCLGFQRLAFEGMSCVLPHAIKFPFVRALVLPENNAAQKRLAHHLLLRLLSVIPPGQLELTVVDPLKQGRSIEPFLGLLKAEQLVPQRRVLTRSNEIEAALGKITDDVEELVQHRFNERTSDWLSYNTANADNPLKYRVLLLFDVPEQCTDKSLWLLSRLCENGPRCGILPVVAIDGVRIEDRRYKELLRNFQQSTARLDSLLHAAHADCAQLSCSYQPDGWPRQAALEAFLAAVSGRYAATARFSKTLSDLWAGFTKNVTTTGGLDVPVGWTRSGECVSMCLGATTSEHHVLLAGKTGSGKSNLLHVLIHTMCEKYSPAEVDLYLLDYKESTEFAVYANPPLPHARLVATESDPEYGVTVLRHLADELKRRSDMFKSAGVPDFTAYRSTCGQQLPRILLVIDEFQVLFSESRQVAEAAEGLFAVLLKQGRSFGIHVLLATQTLKSMNALSIGSMVSQIGCRIALACGQEDSAMILGGGNNWAAAELRSPPEGIINSANGALSGNVKFQIPLAEPSDCREHIARLERRAAKRSLPRKTRVFSGSHLPRHPEAGAYEVPCGQPGAILLGETLTFTSEPLRVPLVTRSAFNVLFSGYNDHIHDGLLASTLRSIAAGRAFDEVVYLNGRGVAPGPSVADASQLLGSRLRSVTDALALPWQDVLDSIGRRRTALIVDGLDSERSLHPVAFKTTRASEPVPPADLLRRVCEEGPRSGTFVFAFVDNWRRCAASCKELLSLFELRIVYCMSEDDAASVVSGAIGKFKGLDRPNRAVFANRMTHEVTWFRPYIGHHAS